MYQSNEETLAWIRERFDRLKGHKNRGKRAISAAYGMFKHTDFEWKQILTAFRKGRSTRVKTPSKASTCPLWDCLLNVDTKSSE